MTDDKQFKAGKAAYNAANAAAHNLSKDAGIKAQKVPADAKTGAHKPGPGDSKATPKNRDVTDSTSQVKLTCPQCGKSTLRAEFPDQYEAWIKCSSCGFFMGMSHDDWHRIENSPNVSEKIKKMAVKQGRLKG